MAERVVLVERGVEVFGTREVRGFFAAGNDLPLGNERTLGSDETGGGTGFAVAGPETGGAAGNRGGTGGAVPSL